MKLKFLLFFLLFSGGILSAQDTIRSLIITEARIDRTDGSYIEITNMGTKPVQLNNFEFGRIDAWTVPWRPPASQTMRLPNKVLQPGQSHTIAAVYDFIEKAHKIDPDNFDRSLTKKEWWTLADQLIHIPDAKTSMHPQIKDSITPGFSVMDNWGGRDCWYLEQHLSAIDSVVVDQVGGVFDEANGTNMDGGQYDVAGFKAATNKAILVRKFVVKNGNINFASARGVGLDDSEWIPIPLSYDDNYDIYRTPFWTVGNHGDYNLDQNTLVSTIADVNWATKTITVPWGTRNQDDVMKVFQKKPGISWFYHLSPARADSAYKSVRTGDKLTIYVAGKDLDVQNFNLVLAPPTADANKVIPMFRTSANGFYPRGINNGEAEAYWVTQNAPGMDSITFDFYGIGFATEADSLLKYLDKAPKAKWEFVWVDGVKRTAVKTGDKLKVTAENGAVKEYYIKVNDYRPSHIAYLSSITWPDIPGFYKDIYGWIGDTIPNFGATAYNYKVSVPLDVEGIPALVAKTQQLNSKVDVKRATTLEGTLEQKTVSFTVTSESGKTVTVYNVQLEKEKDPQFIQPFVAEPFLSEVVFRDNYANNFWEICNPGNQPLDLSNYMFYWGGQSNPANAITSSSGVNDWANRYRKYIPGYKWLNEAEWAANPGKLKQDLNINPIVMPGDVFVMADITNISLSGFPWWASQQSDVIFRNPYNPWGETCNKSAIWYSENFFMFKILNDSVKAGLKPANNPNDFQLLESWSMGDGSRWVIGGVAVNQVFNWMRKPQYYKPVPVAKKTWGTSKADMEWIEDSQAEWQKRGAGWPWWRLNVTLDVGKHFLNEITSYKSTVTSIVYKLSKGFSKKETIHGIKSGTKVAEFLNGIVKADEKQTLKVKAKAGGAVLGMDALLSLNDTLVVMSADSTNTSKYILNVSESGLSSNAILSSNRYKVTIVNSPKSAVDVNEAGTATITGFEYGTTLKTILANITVPPGASMDMVDGKGAYVPLIRLNFDTAYVNVTVNDNIYFDVTAENGITKIVYRLIPSVSQSDAFLTSDVYVVLQKDGLIDFVPRGTNAQVFLSNLVPSAGAKMKLVDKYGMERTAGQIVQNDKVVVTSPDGKNTRVYYLSMLATQYIRQTTYLAYIQSNIYTIDQVGYKVSGVSGSETVAAFLGKVKASQGASASIVDKNGNAKTTGDIDGGDMVKVVSADGKMLVYYTFGILTGVNVYESNNINLYPNPTNGKINVSGVKSGDRIQVYNSVGATIRDINVQSSVESVSLDNQPAGMYMIVISNNNKMLGRYKALRK